MDYETIGERVLNITSWKLEGFHSIRVKENVGAFWREATRHYKELATFITSCLPVMTTTAEFFELTQPLEVDNIYYFEK